ncbi:hypothetical protein [Leifsonia sp. WHRI 6310E]|uniref:hypothetical protein n=1 Tax=Leifsonia sp. WHRI 6310E TaxID=3162562 RepID=UPI0032EFBF3F
MTDIQLTRDELLILLKIVQVFEMSYLVDDPAAIIGQMQQRFERSLARSTARPERGDPRAPVPPGRSHPASNGEQLYDDGSPSKE